MLIFNSKEMIKIINERQEVREYLDGIGLHRDIEYRICFLLAKWFYECGDTTVVKIRNHLKKWAKDNDFYFTVAMNPIAARVIENDMHLLEPEVHISNDDIAIIKECFDTYNEQIVALAVLCYAKAYADEDGTFKLSQRLLGHWIGMNKKTVHKYLQNLENMEYITLCETGEINSWYHKTVVSQMNSYKFNVPVMNEGEFSLDDNNIKAFYELLFLGTVSVDDQWHRIPGYNGWYWLSDSGNVKVCERTIGSRTFSEKILNPFKSSSGKVYYNLMSDGVQRKVRLDKIRELVSKN